VRGEEKEEDDDEEEERYRAKSRGVFSFLVRSRGFAPNWRRSSIFLFMSIDLDSIAK